MIEPDDIAARMNEIRHAVDELAYNLDHNPAIWERIEIAWDLFEDAIEDYLMAGVRVVPFEAITRTDLLDSPFVNELFDIDSINDPGVRS